jgi:hypothetical protein
MNYESPYYFCCLDNCAQMQEVMPAIRIAEDILLISVITGPRVANVHDRYKPSGKRALPCILA